MCLKCWEDEGRPWDVSRAAKEWAPYFAAEDPFGPLHIVVSDWNLDDDSIQYCMDRSETASEKALLSALLEMSEAERWAVAILSEQPDFQPNEWGTH